MKCRWRSINLGWTPGMIDEQITEAVHIAKMLDTKVSFDFSGIKVNVTKNSTIEYTYNAYIQAQKGERIACFGEGW